MEASKFVFVEKKPRYIPLIRNVIVRMIIGFFLLIISSMVTVQYFQGGNIAAVVLLFAIPWLLAVFLTDKYRHKYPQEYMAYLVASHFKAAVVMAFFVGILDVSLRNLAQCVELASGLPESVIWGAFALFCMLDALVSMPCSLEKLENIGDSSEEKAKENVVLQDHSREIGFSEKDFCKVDWRALLPKIATEIGPSLVSLMEQSLPAVSEGNREIRFVEDIPSSEEETSASGIGLLVATLRLNDVRRLNSFLMYCANQIAPGGYFVVRYTPLENNLKALADRCPGILYYPAWLMHFIWRRAIPKIPGLDTIYFSPLFSWWDRFLFSVKKRRNRVLSKAEAWGRLAFHGLEVVAESEGEGELFLISRRTAPPVLNKRPSYYPLVALEKVGLDGKLIKTHKIRTMFPFSEFLQKRIFEEHGLAATGKFKNDFRLTEVGKFIRRYWLDELPQILDWLRGDIKLVGMRATSKHFLSLYPKELYELYIQVKPGLVPPIFDESTPGFDKIVETEWTYLYSYWKEPIRTDIRYFFKTLSDIFLRGIRSK